MKLRITIYVLIWLLMVLAIDTLHTEQTQQSSELQQLKARQQLLGTEVNNMVDNSKSVRDQLSATNNDKQKVQILENALFSEREQTFNLKNKIIYPFNESKTACEQLSNKDKVAILDKIQLTRNNLKELQSINNGLDPNIKKVQNVSSSIEKELILLQNMEDILKIKCKENLGPSIFQSNLNAKNWILGPQTMNDLQEEYAQRALIFHNITNCPIKAPFYSQTQQICIQCEEPNPIFNMYSKLCTRCNLDEELDTDKKTCRSKPHYTNFSSVDNWNLGGGQMPVIDPNLTPCQDYKPYFNGVVCISCDLPHYWSISANLCKQCENGTTFDLNTKRCEKSVSYMLTILQNTNWVSDNLTKVVENRVIILEKNKTMGNYHYCQDAKSPYYDGKTCISCTYFNMDTSKCVQLPKGTQYDHNMKRFVIPESTKQTNRYAKNYVTNSKLIDNSSVPNCNDTFPYYDGIACIQCLKPFNIFNLDQKKCTACNPDEIYVENLHICQLRKKIRISDRFDKLLATQKVTVPQYKETLVKTINNNPDAIIYPCQGKSHYSNLTDCFPCKDNEYFNVQTLKCDICDGLYLDSNQTCRAKVYIFTNLKANKIVDMDGYTVDGQNKRINQFLKTHSQSYICSLQRPYAIENKTCGTCPDLFRYSTLKCTNCSEFDIYVADTKKCQQAIMIVNFTDSKKVLVNQKQTLTSFREQEQNLKNTNLNRWKICPGDRPYTENRQYCFNCTENSPYFNYTIKQCQNCPDHYIFDPKSSTCLEQYFITLINSDTQPRMLGYDDFTMNRYRTEQQAFKNTHPYVICNQSAPFGIRTGCKQCNEPTSYFDIKKKECSDVKYLINFQKISPEYILPKDKNLDSYIAQQQNYRTQALFLTKNCSDSQPYTSDRLNCFNCSSGDYFNFASKKCQKCPQGQAYVKDLKGCNQLFYVSKFTDVSELKMKGYKDYGLEDYRKDQVNIRAKNPYQQCPQTTPYGTLDGCRQCSQPTPYFDIKKLVCSNAKKLINFNGVTTNYTIPDGKNLSFYQENQKNFQTYSESLTVQCPIQTPYTSDRNYCFVCKNQEYLFNFDTKKCQSCPRGSQYSSQKSKCLKLFYITNFTTESEKKMVGTRDYGVSTFKKDELKLRSQNPFVDCTEVQPYGTLDGCSKCLLPEEYYDVKNRKCTAVKKITNFDNIGNNIILKDPKSLNDYKNAESAYQASSQLPTIICSASTPYTSDREKCFNCQTPTPLYNLQTKQCQSCAFNETFDSTFKKCVVKQYYTNFNSASEKLLLQSDGYTVGNYKTDQKKIKLTVGSSQCPTDKPFATSTTCVQCIYPEIYFNIKLNVCQACDSGAQYFDSLHQCLRPAYLTDFTNKNIKETPDVKIADAKKIEQDRAAAQGATPIKCTNPKPFATLKGCISCDDSTAPYFNINTLTCQGCIPFYQYFQNHSCYDNIVLTNTKKMIGFFQVDNFTRYNVEKQNNFTWIANKHVVDCPADTPFYFQAQRLCIACNSSSEPMFDLSQKKCVSVTSLKKSNPKAMKFYIEEGGQTLARLQNEIDVLQTRGVSIDLCPAQTPYQSQNKCINCPNSNKYFNLATQVCQPCDSGQNCISV